jgi:uncharacterized membrane protein
MSQTPSCPSALRRLDGLDAARGAAVVAMIAYHGVWDLASFGLLQVDLFGDPLWLAARTVILGAFLFLAGLGQALAAERGFDRRRFLRRLLILVLAAAAVSAATYATFPASPVFFGVLHHLAVAAVLGLVFTRRPWWVAALAALVVFAADGTLANPVFDRSWLQWVGLMSYPPMSNDYVPVLPWFAVVLAGIAGGRAWRRTGRLAGWRAAGRSARALTWLGRHSLPVYLIHQPILFGGLWLATALFPPAPVGTLLDGYLETCQPACEEQGLAAKDCQRACVCTGERLTREGLMEPLATPDKLTESQRRRIGGIVQLCR